jgi:hypothetical protein
MYCLVSYVVTFDYITHHWQSSLDGSYTHAADHFTQSPDTPHTDGSHGLDDDRLQRQCYSAQLVSASTYNEKDGSDDKHGVSSTDRLRHVLSTKLTEYLTSTRSVSLPNQPTLVDLPKDTVENRHPGWIESPSACLWVDVLTIGDVSDKTLVGQNRARNLVLETCDTYEPTAKGEQMEYSPSVLAVNPAMVHRRKTRRKAHIAFIKGRVSSSDFSWFSLNSVALRSCS